MVTRHFSWRVLLLWLLGFVPGSAVLAGPVSIDYTLSALGAPGRYEYRYTVTNVSLAPSLSWFSIDFDPALYDESTLVIASSGLGNWSEQILGSIPILGVPAQYDAYKVLGAPLGLGESESGFAVQFTWLGAGGPGAQAFTVYDPGNLNVLDSGFTTAAATPPTGVPEPAGLALAAWALGGLWATRRRPGWRAPRALAVEAAA